MNPSIYSGEVFLTGRVVVAVREKRTGAPLADALVIFKADGFS